MHVLPNLVFTGQEEEPRLHHRYCPSEAFARSALGAAQGQGRLRARRRTGSAR